LLQDQKCRSAGKAQRDRKRHDGLTRRERIGQ
jgi:hypothetical protein